MIAIIPNQNISIQDIKTIREFCRLSISEIKHAAGNGLSIRTFEAFDNEWDTEKFTLVKLAKGYNQNTPYQFALLFDDSEIDEFLNKDELNNWIKNLRHIELEEQRNSDLENGYIQTQEEFEPHDDDWTVIE